MSKNDKEKDYSGYSIAFAFMTLAGIIYILPEEYLFSWSKGLTTILLMISSVFFAFSIEETLGNKKIFDNFAVSMALFYLTYGLIIILKYFDLVNRYTVLLIMIILIIPLYGLFVVFFSLGAFVKNNIKKEKGKTVELILKLVPVFLPVINLILKVLKVI